MPKMRIYPHRTASQDAVSWGTWWTERDGHRAPLPALLPGWDYAREETVGVSISFDQDALRESTGIDRLEDLELVALADCKDVQDRFIERVTLAEGYGGERDLVLTVPPGRAAGTLRLTAHLVLARDREDVGGRIAQHKGALLSSSPPFTLTLEGEASRFPTEPVPFSALHLPSSPWRVMTNYSSLHESFMGGVRLLVNTEHLVGQMALDPKTVAQVAPLMRAETMRMLVATADKCTDEFDDFDFDEGSVGGVLTSMCRFFLNRDLAATFEMLRSDPAEFEAQLHVQLNPLGKVFE